MTATITPLHRRSEDQSAFARVDLDAVELLAEGRAASLFGARTEVILKDLRLQRQQMSAFLSDLRSREPTGFAHIDVANTNLIEAIVQGLVQIDLFIAQARGLLERPEQLGAPQLATSGQALRGV